MGEVAYTDSFARIYDEIMGAVPYDLWYNYIHEILDFYQQKPEKILDLACGTGNMSIRFARNGYQVCGVDRSKEMLDIAREKARAEELNINFVEADLREFELENKFELAFSLFDSLNYILQLTDLLLVFENAYHSLIDQGLFIFDMNTLRRLMSIDPGTTLFNGDNYTCFWEDMIDQTQKRWQVRLKIYFDNDKSTYFEEFHQETGYQSEQIVNLLSQVGFEHIDVYNAYTFDRGNDENNRLYYVAFKDQNQVKKKTGFQKLYKKIKWKIKGPY